MTAPLRGRILLAGGEVAVTGTYLVRDHPVEAVLGLAEDLEVGLILVGSRGRGPLGRLLLGSVSEGVVHHARAPEVKRLAEASADAAAEASEDRR